MSKHFAAVTLGALVVALTAASCKCTKTEDPVPAPSATPAPSPPPTVELAVEQDAAPDVEDAGDGDAKKVGTGSYDPTKLMACCRALEQNAKSAPPMQMPAMLAAAQACKAAVQSGNFKAAAGYGCK